MTDYESTLSISALTLQFLNKNPDIVSMYKDQAVYNGGGIEAKDYACSVIYDLFCINKPDFNQMIEKGLNTDATKLYHKLVLNIFEALDDLIEKDKTVRAYTFHLSRDEKNQIFEACVIHSDQSGNLINRQTLEALEHSMSEAPSISEEEAEKCADRYSRNTVKP